MNLKRLLNIAQEADKIGDYVTADKVTNLLKTAQGGAYSVYPNQAVQTNTNSAYPNQATQVNTNAALTDQQYNMINGQYISNIINGAHTWNSAAVKLKSLPPNSIPMGTYKGSPEYQQSVQTQYTVTDKMAKLFDAIRQDNRLTQQQKEEIIAEGEANMNKINSQYNSGQLQQTPGLQISGGEGYAPIPMKNDQGQYEGMPPAPQMNQQMPQQGGVYNPGMAAGATNYTPGVVNVAQPQMTERQRLDAEMNNLKAMSHGASQAHYQKQVAQQADAEKARQSRINYGPAATPTYLKGTNTSAPYQANPNAPVNPNLYGTGYASRAMQPQYPQYPQTPQQQAQPQQQYPYNQRRNPNS